ncbi:MAG: NAD-dependent epimerase/dehydratase family protein, partial [Bacteroidetes bacterium]
MARVVLTGGTGLIGRALLPALRQAGYEPVVLSRRPGQLPQATVIQWDGTSFPAWLSGENVVAVLNLAGAG